LKVSLGILIFISSFIKDALQEDVWHVNLLPRMGDVHMPFKILTCFVWRPSNFLQCTSTFFIYVPYSLK
jgi:hypothetical protein